MKGCVIAILFILLLPIISYAQQNEIGLFTGSLIEMDSDKGVGYAAIKNIKTGEVFLTNEKGIFTIRGAVGDTLKFHSLGYIDTTWVVPGVWFSMQEEVSLRVQTSFYALEEVEVLRFYSYAHFKQAFKDLKLPPDENQKVKDMVQGWDFSEAVAMGKAERKFKEGTFGVSLSVGGKTDIDKQHDEVKRLERIGEERARFNYLTSRENIASLTGYKGTCLDSFMVFINANYQLDYNMAEYDLLASVLRANEDFFSLKGDEFWFLQGDSIQVQ